MEQEVKYQVKKIYCECCGRAFEKYELGEEKTRVINVKEMLRYLDTSDNEVFAEDLKEFVEGYLFDILNDYLPSGSHAVVSKESSDSILKKLLDCLRASNIDIIG